MTVAARVRAGLQLAPLAAAIAAILTSLSIGGGETPGSAAFLAVTLCIILLGSVLFTPPSMVRSAVAENAISIAAAATFMLYTVLTTLPAPAFLAHPIYMALGLETGAISINPTRTFEGLAKFFGPAAAFAIGALAIRDAAQRSTSGQVFLIMGAVYVLFALSTYLAGSSGRASRLDAGLASPNAAATALGLFVLTGVAAIIRANQKGGGSGRFGLTAIARAPFAFSLVLASSVALLLTASRGGVIVTFTAVMLLGLLAVYGRKRTSSVKARGLSLAAPATALALVIILGAHLTLDRMGARLGSAALGRLEGLQVHWAAFLERPWTGHGLNTFKSLNLYYGSPENWDAISMIGAAHNVVLQHLEESGLIGAMLFAIMLAPPVFRSVRAAVGGRSGQVWSCLAVAATFFVFAHGMVDFGLNVPAIAALYAAMLGAYSRRSVYNY